MLTQTAALFLDAYRELNSKKMFWFVLALSLLVVAAFATVGINARGITVLRFEFPSLYNTGIIPRAFFYKLIFTTLGVSYWLNWVGVLLALVSTAGIIPDFIAGGSVDLYLSKPISRLRLFLTKYATGLLFVALQVMVFTTASFVMIGFRASVWDVRLFLAVPIVLLVFSYLFCVCALLGVLTRSTVASLLLTVLFWLMIFGVNTTESILLMGKTAGRIEREAYVSQFASLDRQAEQLKARVAAGEEIAKPELQTVEKRRQDLEEKRRTTDSRRDNVDLAHRVVYAVKTAVPKTAETTALLQRWLDVDENLAEEERLNRRERRRAARAATNTTGGGWFSNFRDRTNVDLDDPDVVREVADTINDRPVSWVMGTSLGFEAAVLGLAAWIFCRRDY